MSKFAAHFWGGDFCSTQGYDQLVKRLKEGKKMCHDFEEYLEKRSQIEREYGEKLVRLAEKSGGKDEIGTLRKSWDQLKSETEAVGRLHISLSQKISEEIYRTLKEFKETQRDTRKKSEDTVKRAATHKRTCFDRNNRAHNQYEQKCRDADRAEEAYNKLQSVPTTKPQDLLKSQRRSEGARSASKHSDQLYMEAVKNLEEARSLWEREMELLCRQFQELEEQRIAFVRHQIWSLCNMFSQTTIYEDQSYENVRLSLEDCNIDKDIDLFVSEHAIGEKRPLPIVYINYYNPVQTQDVPPSKPAGGRIDNPSTLQGPPQMKLPPIPPNEDTFGADGDGVYSTIEQTNSTNATVPPAESYYASPKSFGKVIVLYNYESQGSQELSIEEGDIITVIGREDEVWWCGKLDKNTGMFPAAYVEPYDEV